MQDIILTNSIMDNSVLENYATAYESRNYLFDFKPSMTSRRIGKQRAVIATLRAYIAASPDAAVFVISPDGVITGKEYLNQEDKQEGSKPEFQEAKE